MVWNICYHKTISHLMLLIFLCFTHGEDIIHLFWRYKNYFVQGCIAVKLTSYQRTPLNMKSHECKCYVFIRCKNKQVLLWTLKGYKSGFTAVNYTAVESRLCLRSIICRFVWAVYCCIPVELVLTFLWHVHRPRLPKEQKTPFRYPKM